MNREASSSPPSAVIVTHQSTDVESHNVNMVQTIDLISVIWNIV